jgi:hypothetical protein
MGIIIPGHIKIQSRLSNRATSQRQLFALFLLLLYFSLLSPKSMRLFGCTRLPPDAAIPAVGHCGFKAQDKLQIVFFLQLLSEEM